MRAQRVLPAALLAVLVTTTGVAHAAKPKVICNIVTDVEGDGRSKSVGVLSSPALDVLSVDVATTKKSASVILRLKTTKIDGDPVAQFSMKWAVNFVVKGTTYTFGRTHGMGPSATYANFMTIGTDTAGPEPTVVVTPTSIQWTVPRKAVTNLKRLGVDPLTQIGGVTFVNGGNADLADGPPTLKYLDLAPTCVKLP
jgi:hypothetical protein